MRKSVNNYVAWLVSLLRLRGLKFAVVLKCGYFGVVGRMLHLLRIIWTAHQALLGLRGLPSIAAVDASYV